MQSNDALLKSYQDAAGIGNDVDKLQESIDHLVRSMGLEPGDQQSQGQNGLSGVGAQGNMGMGQGVDGNVQGGGGMGGGSDFDLGGDFDVDEFLDNLGKDQAGH